MLVNNDRAKELIIKKQNLCLQESKGYISEEEYRTGMESIDEELNKICSEINNIKEEPRGIKMANEKVEVTKKEVTKKEVTKRDNSNASLIAKALSMKSIKNVDDVVEKVLELKPEAEAKKIKSQTKIIINETIKGKGRWVNYTWDKDTFTLSEKA